MKNNITGYALSRYFKSEDIKKSAILSIKLCFGFNLKHELFNIELDEEDIKILLDKYKISKIQEKELELSKTVEELNLIQLELNKLKSI